MEVNARAFYFTVVFWGKEFRDYFMTLLLASLLSPNNIPALKNKKDSRFVIATTEEDWNAIQNETLYLVLKSFIDVIYIKLDIATDMSKMRLMSQGHKQISEVLFADKAIGVFVTPDLVLSDGTVVALQHRIAEGKKVVLCPAIRFEYQGCMREFNRLGVMQLGKPMILLPRQLMSIALRNLHSETKTWLWDEPYYAHNPVCSMWRLPGGDNFVLHGYSWAPLAVDYAALKEHDVSTFDLSTLDQDYVYKNFGVSEDIYVVTDSDELSLVSFTDERDLHIPLIPHVSYQVPGLKNLVNKDNLRHFHYSPIHGMDPLKHKLIHKAILLHTSDIGPSWRKTIKTAARMVKCSVQKKPKVEENLAVLIYDLYHFSNFKIPLLLKPIFLQVDCVLRSLKGILYWIKYVWRKPYRFFSFKLFRRAYQKNRRSCLITLRSWPKILDSLWVGVQVLLCMFRFGPRKAMIFGSCQRISKRLLKEEVQVSSKQDSVLKDSYLFIRRVTWRRCLVAGYVMQYFLMGKIFFKLKRTLVKVKMISNGT